MSLRSSTISTKINFRMDALVINLFKFFTVLYGLKACYQHVRLIIQRRSRILSYVYLIFFVFYIFPLALDFLSGKPQLDMFPLFVRSFNDYYTNIVYCIFMGVLIYNFKDKSSIEGAGGLITRKQKFDLLKEMTVLIIALLPLILVFIFEHPEVYLIYRDHADVIVESRSPIPGLIYLTTSISVLVIFINAVAKDYSLKYFILFSPILFADIWLNGKRNILALILVFFFLLIFNNKVVSNKMKIFISAVIICGTVLLNNFYQNSIRESKPEDFYTGFRIDFGRDAALKAGIYKVLYSDSERPILEFPGQTFLFYATIFIDRETWKEKPYPYAQYFTSAALDAPPQMWGWGLTTSFFEECISNFSIFGFFIGPFIFFRIIRKASKLNNKIFDLFTILICGILLTVEITAYYLLFVSWVVYFLYLGYQKKKSDKKINSVL